MLAIILSIIISAYITYEAIVYLKSYYQFKKNGIVKKVKIVDVAPNKKTYGIVPVVEIVKDDGKIVKSTIKSSFFSWWNKFNYKNKMIKIIYLEDDLNVCVRYSKVEIMYIYLSMLITYLFVGLSLVVYLD